MPPCGGAGADGHQVLRLPPDLADALGVVRRGDRSLDQRQIVRAVRDGTRRFQESWRSRPRRRASGARPRNRASESWQPSQEANFQTASSGAPSSRSPFQISRMVKISAIRSNRMTGPSLQRRSVRTGSDRTDRWRTSCCAPSKDRCGRAARPASRSAFTVKRIITSGPQISATASCGSKAARGIERRHYTDIAVPIGIGVIDRHFDFDIEVPAPLLQFAAIKNVIRVTAAEQNDHAAIAAAVGEDIVDRRPQRREAKAAGHNHDIAPSAASSGQPVPNGPRRPIIAPDASFAIAPLTAPTSRTVCTKALSSRGRRSC